MPRTIDIAALLIRQRLMQDIFGKVHLLAKIVAIQPKLTNFES